MQIKLQWDSSTLSPESLSYKRWRYSNSGKDAALDLWQYSKCKWAQSQCKDFTIRHSMAQHPIHKLFLLDKK